MIRTALIWAALMAALLVPVAAAAFSPLLAWRSGIYIAAGFAGIIGLGLMVIQPLAATNALPGLSRFGARQLHRVSGVSLLICVGVHIAGLWLTSPPDMIDALLLRSPTSFSIWGVIAMWAIAGAGILALLRRKLRLRWRIWRLSHAALATVAVCTTLPHALLIDGTMETFSKIALCLLALCAIGWMIARASKQRT